MASLKTISLRQWCIWMFIFLFVAFGVLVVTTLLSMACGFGGDMCIPYLTDYVNFNPYKEQLVPFVFSLTAIEVRKALILTSLLFLVVPTIRRRFHSAPVYIALFALLMNVLMVIAGNFYFSFSSVKTDHLQSELLALSSSREDGGPYNGIHEEVFQCAAASDYPSTSTYGYCIKSLSKRAESAEEGLMFCKQYMYQSSRWHCVTRLAVIHERSDLCTEDNWAPNAASPEENTALCRTVFHAFDVLAKPEYTEEAIHDVCGQFSYTSSLYVFCHGAASYYRNDPTWCSEIEYYREMDQGVCEEVARDPAAWRKVWVTKE